MEMPFCELDPSVLAPAPEAVPAAGVLRVLGHARMTVAELIAQVGDNSELTVWGMIRDGALTVGRDCRVAARRS
jgi:hypothetical protein